MKVCIKCKEEKGSEEFYKASRMKGGLDYYCKSCRTEVTIKSHNNPNKPKCSVDGCENVHYAKTYCQVHYARLQNTGSLELRVWHKEDCSVEGCERDAFSKTLCRMHYNRVKSTGNIGPAYPLSGRGDNVGYDTAHRRKTKKDGKASDYTCVDCGRQARHWSLKHDATEMREEKSKRGADRIQGAFYSLNAEDYEPRCIGCHYAYDYKHGLRVRRA